MSWIFSRTAALALATLAVLALAACSGDDGGTNSGEINYPYPYETVAELPRSHFAPGTIYDEYNSNPPTSGPHSQIPANWGVSDLAVPKETAVHNMEHGGVVIWYNCNGGPAPLSTDECTMLRNDLSSVAQTSIAAGNYVLMTPYPDMDTRIALTAWTYLDTFDDFDAERVSSFIDNFECRYNEEGFCS